VPDTGALQVSDLDDLAGVLAVAGLLTGSIADTAQDTRQGHGFLKNFDGLGPPAASQVAQKRPDIHVKGAGGGARRQFFLDASVLPLPQFRLVHVFILLARLRARRNGRRAC
jgi:hypothetical protein